MPSPPWLPLDEFRRIIRWQIYALCAIGVILAAGGLAWIFFIIPAMLGVR